MKPRPAAVLAALLAPLASLEAQTVVDATEPEVLAEIVRDLGYRAELTVDNIGDPLINSAVSGSDFSIYFYGCSDNRDCTTLLFKIGYDLADGTTLESINDWNENTLYGRSYVDDEADPWLELSVNLAGGVSRDNFADTFDWWEILVAEFEDYIGF